MTLHLSFEKKMKLQIGAIHKNGFWERRAVEVLALEGRVERKLGAEEAAQWRQRRDFERLGLASHLWRILLWVARQNLGTITLLPDAACAIMLGAAAHAAAAAPTPTAAIAATAAREPATACARAISPLHTTRRDAREVWVAQQPNAHSFFDLGACTACS